MMIGNARTCAIGLAALSLMTAGCAMEQKPLQLAQAPRLPQQAVLIPADLQTAVQSAELWGHALYESYTAQKAVNDKAVDRAIETVHQSVKDHCSGTYRAVAVMPPAAPAD